MKHLLHHTATSLVVFCLLSLNANAQVTIPVGTTTRSMIVYVPTATGVYVTAYKSGSKIVLVAVNQNTAVTYQPFNITGVTVAGFNRYRTTSSANLTSDSFTISGGAFGINLPASSVTTLVSY